MIIVIPYKSKKDGTIKLIKRFSNSGMQIRKVGTDELYSEAIDVEYAPFTYTETDIPIDTHSGEEATDADYQSALQELGVTFDEEDNIE